VNETENIVTVALNGMEADIYGAQNGTWLGAGAFPAHSNNKHHQERLKHPFARGNVLSTGIDNHNFNKYLFPGNV